jgi:toxin ParE1/3/4
MAEVTWTEQALEDLVQICDALSRDSEPYARVIATRVFAAADRLRDFPESGRIVPERSRSDLREIVVPPFRMIYRADAGSCEILCVIHGKQEFPAGVAEDAVAYSSREAEREERLARLIDSVGMPPGTVRSDAALAREIVRRAEEVKAGTVELVEWEAARKRIETKLRNR